MAQVTQHERFLERLRASKRGVFAVAYWLHGFGYTVEIAANGEAPTASDHQNFVDHGDLFITRDSRRRRIEVKTVGFTFTGRADWPFNEVFVSNVATVDRSGDEVAVWITVSNDLAAAAIIDSETRAVWNVRTILARNTGNEERNYAAPLYAVKFVPLDF